VAVKVRRGAVLVLTDREYGATFTGADHLDIYDDAIILTVRDDASEEQRDAARKRAAEIVAAREKGVSPT